MANADTDFGRNKQGSFDTIAPPGKFRIVGNTNDDNGTWCHSDHDQLETATAALNREPLGRESDWGLLKLCNDSGEVIDRRPKK